MSKRYIEVPSNFADFEKYLIYEQEELVKAYFLSENYFFYDTCSILHHSNSNQRQFIINFLINKSATIIITRTVLMELTANSFKLHPTQIQYLKELYDNGLKVLLINEEMILDCLKEALTITIEDANRLLGYAVKEVSKFKTITNDILNNIHPAISAKLRGPDPGKVELFSDFFQFARSKKTQGDSLAEELILICIIVLTKFPRNCKYIIISDDHRAIYQVITINRYIKQRHNVPVPFQLTTVSLLDRMYKENIIVSKDDILDILKSAFRDKVPVAYIGEYDMQQVQGTFDCEKLIDRLLTEKDFKIIY